MSIENLINEAWEKYKEEGGALSNKEKN